MNSLPYSIEENLFVAFEGLSRTMAINSLTLALFIQMKLGPISTFHYSVTAIQVF